MSDETKPQDSAAMPPASAGSTVNVGKELAERLRAFRDRLVSGESFERITRRRCYLCNGSGQTQCFSAAGADDYGMVPCPACGGNGSTEHRERIDLTRVIIKDR